MTMLSSPPDPGRVEEILRELYELDPALRSREPELKNIVREMLLSKPDTRFDAEFARRLRRELLVRAQSAAPEPGRGFTLWQKLSFAGAGALVIALAVLAGNYYSRANRTGAPGAQNNSLFAEKPEFVALGGQAFGPLTNLAASGATGGGSESAPAGTSAAAPSNAGASAPQVHKDAAQPPAAAPLMAPAAGQPPADASAPAQPEAPLPNAKISGPAIVPPVVNYRYAYTGGEFTVGQNEMNVLRRAGGFNSGGDAAAALRSLNFGLLDMGTFNSPQIQSFNLTENSDFGYVFYVNMDDGTVNISQNWTRWPNPAQNCQDQACFDAARIKISDIPAGDRVIAAANQFLKDHGISLDNYGQPVVQDQWRVQYEQAADKSQVYLPDAVSVIYPQVLDGRQAVDESGSPSGLMVSVDARYQKVSGVSGLASLRYEASAYPVVTDAAEIIKSAEAGGYGGQIFYPLVIDSVAGGAPKTVTLNLGTPELKYMKAYKYQDNRTQELLVPAMVFPVTNPPSGQPYYYRQNVVVPLVKDLLDNGGGIVPPIKGGLAPMN